MNTDLGDCISQSERPRDANATMGEVRGAITGFGRTRILYGGSVEPATIADLIAQPHIDGALVGGAGLDARSCAALLRNAGAIRSRALV